MPPLPRVAYAVKECSCAQEILCLVAVASLLEFSLWAGGVMGVCASSLFCFSWKVPPSPWRGRCGSWVGRLSARMRKLLSFRFEKE